MADTGDMTGVLATTAVGVVLLIGCALGVIWVFRRG
jgi:hypothetical protein